MPEKRRRRGSYAWRHAEERYDVTENHEDADAIIVNSCGFIDDAKSESVEAILKRRN